MKKKLFVMMVFGIFAGTCFSEIKDVDEKSEKMWQNYTIPLPHEISIKKAKIVSPKDIGLKLSATSGDIEKNVYSQLKTFFKEKTGIEPNGNKFEIILGVLGKDNNVCGIKIEKAERLRTLPNNDQAYLIQPSGDNKLVLASLTPKGVFYAVQTLKQLLCKQINKDSVSIPLANITDWPDMNQRGLWNIGYSLDFITWLSSLKLNTCVFGTGVILKKGEKAKCRKLPTKLMHEARNCAFLLMPHAPHFDYWWRYGMNKLYPELVGKGDGARNPCYRWGGSFKFCRCPCLATPHFTQLLTEWIENAADQGAQEFGLWQSEHTCQCECEQCLKNGRKQMQKEVQACVDAITAARRKYPNLQGRIFLCLTERYGNKIEDFNECLAIIPSEIKTERVYGANKVLDKYAADGNFLISYSGPPLGPGYFTIRYMTNEIKTCVKKYYDAKYSGVYPRSRCLVSPSLFGHFEKAFCNYQYSALAEWSWNVKGRNIRQFAKAWATVNQFDNPTLFADWIEIITPIENFLRYWDGQITNWQKAADELKNIKTTPNWIKRLPKPDEMQKMVSKCELALSITKKVNNQSVLLETQYLLTYLHAMMQFRDLYNQCASKEVKAPENQKNIKETAKKFDTTIKKLDQLCDALMTTPEVDPKHGPEEAKKRYKQWKKSICEKVNASIDTVTKQ